MPDGAGGRRTFADVSRGRLAARPRRPAALLEILLNLRFHPARQYRTGGGSPDGKAGRKPDHLLPGIPGERTVDLHGQPVRWRPAAGREPDEGPPADADARFEPDAAARPAGKGKGRASALARGIARGRRHSRPAGGAGRRRGGARGAGRNQAGRPGGDRRSGIGLRAGNRRQRAGARHAQAAGGTRAD